MTRLFTGGCMTLFLMAALGAASAQEAQRVLRLEPGPGNPRNSEGDFIQLSDGRILYAYTRFTGDASDYGAADIAGRYSSDDGRTWTQEDAIILKNEGAVNTMSVSLLRLQSGRIAFLYLVKASKGDCRPYLRFSDDETKTWTEPILCVDTPGYFVVNNDRLVQLRGGRLLIPAARHGLGQEKIVSRGSALCLLSDDEGKTWRQSESALEAPPESKAGLQEPAVIELKDGRLMMLCRTDMGSQYRSYSHDGGVSWSSAEATDILSPLSPASLVRMPKTDDILLAWNDHRDITEALKTCRTPFTLAVSNDEGLTWNRIRTLDDDPNGWYCYTALECTEESLLLAYCAGDRRTGGLNTTQIVRIPFK